MKQAFAKLIQKDPVESSHIAFRAGGNNVPILTRASSSSTTGYQTMGLPTGSKPSPGGGANITTLGAIRMGDQDGNGPASAIVGGPTDIFYPPGQPDRVYPERTFANVGNNVFQPENDDSATLALLRRLGDQKFKAESMAPFEDYRAQQKLAIDLQEASKNASLSDLGLSREIIRNLAEKRRQQNEDDYLRRMLDSGATPEAARKEIEDVRNANAIQEARKIEDREYQAKTLIQRIAASRGITPMVREPLTNSSSIDNPQRSQAMSQAMGMPGEGFGTSPLDMNRQFMTPDFYKKFLRRSALTQESADQDQAFSSLLADGEIPLPPSGAYSMATLRGQERQMQVENASEALAARLETIRSRANRVLLPLPSNVIAKDVLDELYKNKGSKPGKRVLFSSETIQDMRTLQLLIALNLTLSINRSSVSTLLQQLNGISLGTVQNPSPKIIEDLKNIVIIMNKNDHNISIPYASSLMSIPNTKLVTILQDIRTSSALQREADAAYKQYEDYMKIWRELTQPERKTALPTVAIGTETARQAIAEVPIPGAPDLPPFVGAIRRGMQAFKSAGGQRRAAPAALAPPDDGYASMTLKELKAELKKQGKPVSVPNKDAAITRLRE